MTIDWQPIATVPRDTTPVLVWLSEPHLHSHVHAAWFAPNMTSGCIGGCFGFDLKGKPTHWAPQPSGPLKAEGSQDE